MMRHLLALNWLVSVIVLSISLQNYSAVAAGPPHLIAAVTDKASVSPKKNMADRHDSRSVETIVAELSDEQVRRMLIEELKKDAEQPDRVEDRKKTGGLVNFVRKIRFIRL